MTIAGSDPGGGAGIQADLKVFAAHGVFGTSVVTALTSQNTLGVSAVDAVPASTIRSQFRALKEDLPHAAAKCGMLGTAENAKAIAHLLGRPPMPLVLDPVLASSSGMDLIGEGGLDIYRQELIPLALIFTPNLTEAAQILNLPSINSEGMRDACRALARLGCRTVYLKGGHLEGDACDDLFFDGEFLELKGARINTKNTHGTGCTLSAALCAQLALGKTPREAAPLAHAYVRKALEGAATWRLGGGHGPLDHFPQR